MELKVGDTGDLIANGHILRAVVKRISRLGTLNAVAFKLADGEIKPIGLRLTIDGEYILNGSRAKLNFKKDEV